MVDPTLNPHEMYDWESFKIMMPRDENGEGYLPRAPKPVAGRRSYSVPEMCFMTLGRGIGTPEKMSSNYIETTLANEKNSGAPADAKNPPIDDESWRVVFLVPVSEVTDRWTVTLHRMVPYEVRNDIWFLDKNQKGPFLSRTNERFNTLLENKWLNTTGYLMQLRR